MKADNIITLLDRFELATRKDAMSNYPQSQEQVDKLREEWLDARTKLLARFEAARALLT